MSTSIAAHTAQQHPSDAALKEPVVDPKTLMDDLQSEDDDDHAGAHDAGFADRLKGIALREDGNPLNAGTAAGAAEPASIDWGGIDADRNGASGTKLSTTCRFLASNSGLDDTNSTSRQPDGRAGAVDANSTSLLGTSQRRTPNAPIKTRNVYVGALPLSFTDADLTALLSEFGKVKSCRMFNTGARVAEIGRAYGFGLFEESGAAERAVTALDGKPLGNGRLQCQLSRNGVVKKPKDAVRCGRGPSATPEKSSTSPQTMPPPSQAVAAPGLGAAAPAAALPFTTPEMAPTPPPLMPFPGLPGGYPYTGAPLAPAAFNFPMPFGAPTPPVVMPPPQPAANASPAVPVMTPNGVVWMRPA